MTTKYEDGDVEIYGIVVNSATGNPPVDIRGLLLSMSIYEDIEQPTVFAELIIRDEKDLVNLIPIYGEEDITITFKTPGRDNFTTYELKIYNIVSADIALNNAGAAYKLECISHEHFLGTIFNVEQSYKDSISNMVNDLLVNKLKTDKRLDIEKTKGIVNITMPRIKLFPAVDMLRQRAISSSPMGGVFVFYQDQEGIHFKTLEKLFDEGMNSTYPERTYTYSPVVNTDEELSKLSYRNIINYDHLKKTNNVEKIYSGVFNNNTKAYDLLSKKIDDTSFKLTEQTNRIITGQSGKARAQNTPSFINKYSNVNDYRFFMAKDSSKPNDYLDNYQSYKQAFATLFNQNIVRAFINGDNYLKVGDVVDLRLPEPSAHKTTDREDPSVSGNYLITKLRHLIFLEQGKFKHRISFDCNRPGNI